MKQKGRKKTTLTKGMHRGFTRGLNQVKLGQTEEVRAKLREIIGGCNPSKMYYWVHGKTIITPQYSKRIERLFKRYGITDIWDE